MRRHTETTLVRAPEAARQARRAVAEACADWRIGNLEPDAEIVATELVENTLQHTESTPRLQLMLRDDALTVAVSDDEAATACVGEDEPARRGLGMLLVAQLTRAWGCTHDRAGKTVWAVLRAPR